MSERTCIIDDCVGRVVGHGWCDKHYRRWKRNGHPTRQAERRRRETQTTPCSIEGCSTPLAARSWCEKHYRRWQATGDPLISRRVIGDDVARFWSHVDKSNQEGCWVWTGSISSPPRGPGYGTFRLDDRTRTAHIVSYLWHHGEDSIPDGYVLDHLCRNQHCVNPAHLDPVTQRENVHRGARLKVTDQRVRELHALYRGGTGIAALARAEGVAPQTLRSRFRKLANFT